MTYKTLTGHFSRLLKSHHIQKRGGYIAQLAVVFQKAYAVVADGDERHAVRGVRGEGGAVGFVHIVAVAVVGGDKRLAAHGQNGVHNLLYAFVNHFDRLARGFEHAGMSHHVAVCEVEYHHVVLARLDLLAGAFGNLVSAHFGLHVEGGYLGGIY